jgi:hypothetical protein
MLQANGLYEAEITWHTSEPSSTRVSAYSNAFNEVLDPTLTTIHRVIIPDLQPQTLYHYRVESIAGGLSTIGFGHEVYLSFMTP